MSKKDYKAIQKDDEAFNKFRHNFALQALRRATYRWPYGHMKMAENRIERGMYKCESCQQCFGPKEINKDHIIPVVDVKTGFTTWDDYIQRLLVKSDGYQILCLTCHSSKSAVENEMRKTYGQKPIRTNKKKKK